MARLAGLESDFRAEEIAVLVKGAQLPQPLQDVAAVCERGDREFCGSSCFGCPDSVVGRAVYDSDYSTLMRETLRLDSIKCDDGQRCEGPSSLDLFMTREPSQHNDIGVVRDGDPGQPADGQLGIELRAIFMVAGDDYRALVGCPNPLSYPLRDDAVTSNESKDCSTMPSRVILTAGFVVTGDANPGGDRRNHRKPSGGGHFNGRRHVPRSTRADHHSGLRVVRRVGRSEHWIRIPVRDVSYPGARDHVINRRSQACRQDRMNGQCFGWHRITR